MNEWPGMVEGISQFFRPRADMPKAQSSCNPRNSTSPNFFIMNGVSLIKENGFWSNYCIMMSIIQESKIIWT